MKLAAQMLRLTGDPACMDEIERSAYNALLGAQSVDGGWWCHHTPLAGIKERAPEQCDMQQNCCVANGPRGLLLLPQLAVMSRADGPVINLYNPMRAKVPVADGWVSFETVTDFPVHGTVKIRVTPDVPRTFVVSLRIPGWSEKTALTINGEPQPQPVPQTYVRVLRHWQPGDVITLELDMRAHVVSAPGDSRYAAVTRGPLVLARDQRLEVGSIDQPVALKVGVLETIGRSANRPPNVSQVFTLGEHGLLLCDFASAGNTWSPASTYRVWLPLNLDEVRSAPPSPRAPPSQ
jgi:DUF1680 family protein